MHLNQQWCFRVDTFCVIWQLIQVLEIQLPGKKVMNAAAFWNGLRGQQLKRFDE